MSLIAGQIKAIITADNSQFKQATKDTDRSLKGLSAQANKTSSAFSGLFKGIAAGAGVTGLAKLTSESFKLATNFEQIKVSFKTLTGSASIGGNLIKEIKDLAASTPLTSNALFGASKALISFGFDAKSIVPTLKTLGDISAGTGKDIKELSIIYGQIRSAGRLMGQDLLQLINAGFNPLQEISRSTGRSMRDLKDDMSKGLITFDQVENAFKSATSSGGLFFNMMNEQSQTFNGRMSTLKDNLEQIGTNIGTFLIKPMGEFVELAIKGSESVKRVTEGKGTTGENVAVGTGIGAVGLVGSIIGANLASNLISKFLSGDTLFNLLFSKGEFSKKTIRKYSEIAGKLYPNIENQPPAKDILKDLNSMKKYLGSFNTYSLLFSGLVQNISVISTRILGLFSAVNIAWASIIVGVTLLAKTINDIHNIITGENRSLLKGVVDSFISMFKYLNPIGLSITTAKAAVDLIPDGWADSIIGFFKEIGRIASNVQQTRTGPLSDYLSKFMVEGGITKEYLEKSVQTPEQATQRHERQRQLTLLGEEGPTAIIQKAIKDFDANTRAIFDDFAVISLEDATRAIKFFGLKTVEDLNNVSTNSIKDFFASINKIFKDAMEREMFVDDISPAEYMKKLRKKKYDQMDFSFGYGFEPFGEGIFDFIRKSMFNPAKSPFNIISDALSTMPEQSKQIRFGGAYAKGSVEAYQSTIQTGVSGSLNKIEQHTQFLAKFANMLDRNGIKLNNVDLAF